VSSLQKLLDLPARERDALALDRLCRASESTETRRGVRVENPVFDGVVEQAADYAQRVADGVSGKSFSNQVVDRRSPVATESSSVCMESPENKVGQQLRWPADFHLGGSSVLPIQRFRSSMGVFSRVETVGGRRNTVSAVPLAAAIARRRPPELSGVSPSGSAVIFRPWSSTNSRHSPSNWVAVRKSPGREERLWTRTVPGALSSFAVVVPLLVLRTAFLVG
jgi:hypothetical protein